jgi:DNA-binding NarL/FixJ family response regulator
VIRVLVVDDHAVVRTGLEEMLRTDDELEFVGAAADGAAAVELAVARDADVVLMDLSMPGTDGIDATRRILAAKPDTNIVVLTSFSDRERILQAVDAGAVGYLLKDAEPGELLAGVRAAARGESPLAPKAARALIASRSERSPSADLSERELEVLRLVAEGLPNKEIARRLRITEKTVKAHLTSVFRQIDVFDRMQAALWARKHGLVGDRPES